MRVLVVRAHRMNALDITSELEEYFKNKSKVVIRSFDSFGRNIADLARAVADLEPREIAVLDLSEQPEDQFNARLEAAHSATCRVIIHCQSNERAKSLSRETWENKWFPLILSTENNNSPLAVIEERINYLLALDCHDRE